jgi:hypothetical protein
MIGKPYSGKLNVRFDEGELEIEPRLLRQFPTLPPYPSPHTPIGLRAGAGRCREAVADDEEQER